MSGAAAIVYPLLYFFDSGGWFASVLPSVVLHELGHCAAIYLCGGCVRALRLDLGGLCLDTSPFSSRGEELVCAAAGPAAGLLWLLPAKWIGGEWGEKSALCALLLNGFNLLPALPLDGGRVLLSLSRSRTLVRISAFLTAAALLCLALARRQWRLAMPCAVLLAEALRP